MQALNFGILPEGRKKKKTGKCQGVLTQPQPSRVIPAKTYTAAIRDHKSTLIIKEVPYKTLCKRSCPAGLSLLVTSDQIFQRKNCLPLQVISLHQIKVSKELFFVYHTTPPTTCQHIAGTERGGAGKIRREVGPAQLFITQLNQLLQFPEHHHTSASFFFARTFSTSIRIF